MNNPTHVFVDTNVLINDFLYRSEANEAGKKAYNALVYLRSQQKQTFIASFSILQFIATFQRRIAFEDLSKEIQRFVSHHTVIELTTQDIINGINTVSNETPDLEDCIQYTLSQKLKCFYILTNNTRDFQHFANIVMVTPKKHRAIT